MKTKILTLVIAITGILASFTQPANAQANKAKAQADKDKAPLIEKFEQGKPVSQDEFNFLQSITGAKKESKELKIEKFKITVGQSLNKEEAVAINNKVKSYVLSHKDMETKTGNTRGCCRWVWRCCDYFGNGWWVCVWWDPGC